MITPDSSYPQRTTLVQAAVITGLLLISAAVVINHVTLSNLVEQSRGKASSTQIAMLEGQLAELTGYVEQRQQPPTALPQARYESERRALDLQLASIEQALGTLPTADDLLSLQHRIEQLETRLTTAQPSTPAASRPRIATPARPIEPPFRVIGVELRAGERFLSILPTSATALTQVQLLRPGEAEAGWYLDAIEGDTAVFQQGNQTRRLKIP